MASCALPGCGNGQGGKELLLLRNRISPPAGGTNLRPDFSQRDKGIARTTKAVAVGISRQEVSMDASFGVALYFLSREDLKAHKIVTRGQGVMHYGNAQGKQTTSNNLHIYVPRVYMYVRVYYMFLLVFEQ